MRRTILAVGIPATIVSFLVVSAALRAPRHRHASYAVRAATWSAPRPADDEVGGRVVMPGAIVDVDGTGCVTVREGPFGGRREAIRRRREIERCLRSYARAAIAAGRVLSVEQRAIIDSLNERVRELADSVDGTVTIRRF